MIAGKKMLVVSAHAADYVWRAGGTIANRGTTEEIFPLILANTLGGCPVLRKEEQK